MWCQALRVYQEWCRTRSPTPGSPLRNCTPPWAAPAPSHPSCWSGADTTWHKYIAMPPAFNLPTVILFFFRFVFSHGGKRMYLFPGATVSGWCHGVSAEQHATQLASGSLRPPDHWESRGGHGDGAERPTQIEPAGPVYPTHQRLITLDGPLYSFNGVSVTSLNVIYLKIANVIDHFVHYLVRAVSLYTVTKLWDPAIMEPDDWCYTSVHQFVPTVYLKTIDLYLIAALMFGFNVKPSN